MKRSWIKRGTTPLRRYTRLPFRSKKTIERQPERVAMRDEVISATRGRCCARTTIAEIRCWGPTEVHELIDRSLRPGVQYEPEFGVTLCKAHHDWVSADWDRAHHRGFSYHSWEVADAVEQATFLRWMAALAE